MKSVSEDVFLMSLPIKLKVIKTFINHFFADETFYSKISSYSSQLYFSFWFMLSHVFLSDSEIVSLLVDHIHRDTDNALNNFRHND